MGDVLAVYLSSWWGEVQSGGHEEVCVDSGSDVLRDVFLSWMPWDATSGIIRQSFCNAVGSRPQFVSDSEDLVRSNGARSKDSVDEAIDSVSLLS